MKQLDQFLGGLLPRSAMGLLHDIYDFQLPFAPISGHIILNESGAPHAVIVKCTLLKSKKAITFTCTYNLP